MPRPHAGSAIEGRLCSYNTKHAASIQTMSDPFTAARRAQPEPSGDGVTPAMLAWLRDGVASSEVRDMENPLLHHT